MDSFTTYNLRRCLRLDFSVNACLGASFVDYIKPKTTSLRSMEILANGSFRKSPVSDENKGFKDEIPHNQTKIAVECMLDKDVRKAFSTG